METAAMAVVGPAARRAAVVGCAAQMQAEWVMGEVRLARVVEERAEE